MTAPVWRAAEVGGRVHVSQEARCEQWGQAVGVLGMRAHGSHWSGPERGATVGSLHITLALSEGHAPGCPWPISSGRLGLELRGALRI